MSSKKGTLLIIVILVAALLYLVYFVLTKGYSGNGIKIAPVLQNATQSAAPAAKEDGSVTSAKISLVVTSPKDGETLNSTNATVKGKTVPGADVFVNDQSGKADTNGNFMINIGLDEGSNVLVVLANDASGNAAEQDLTVMVSSFQ